MKLCWMPRLVILDNPKSSTKSVKEKSILMWESDLLLLGIMQTVLIGHQESYMDGALFFLVCGLVRLQPPVGLMERVNERERER